MIFVLGSVPVVLLQAGSVHGLSNTTHRISAYARYIWSSSHISLSPSLELRSPTQNTSLTSPKAPPLYMSYSCIDLDSYYRTPISHSTLKQNFLFQATFSQYNGVTTFQTMSSESCSFLSQKDSGFRKLSIVSAQRAPETTVLQPVRQMHHTSPFFFSQRFFPL